MKLMIFISSWQCGHSSGSTSHIFYMHLRYVGGVTADPGEALLEVSAFEVSLNCLGDDRPIKP